jgi:RNA polymerase sigma-70 factor, ECF subfamily
MSIFGENLKDIYPELQPIALKWSNYNPDEADDLIQKTLLKALEKQHLYQEDGSLVGWVVTIMKNTLYDDTKKMKGKTHVDIDEEKLSTKSNTLQIEVENTVSAIQRLNAKCQAVLTLIAEGYKYAEIAQKLELPIGTIMSQLVRCRKKLFDELNTKIS